MLEHAALLACNLKIDFLLHGLGNGQQVHPISSWPQGHMSLDRCHVYTGNL